MKKILSALLIGLILLTTPGTSAAQYAAGIRGEPVTEGQFVKAMQWLEQIKGVPGEKAEEAWDLLNTKGIVKKTKLCSQTYAMTDIIYNQQASQALKLVYEEYFRFEPNYDGCPEDPGFGGSGGATTGTGGLAGVSGPAGGCDTGGLYASSKATVTEALDVYFAKYGSYHDSWKKSQVIAMLDRDCYFSMPKFSETNPKASKLGYIHAHRNNLSAAKDSNGNYVGTSPITGEKIQSLLDVVADSEGVHSTPQLEGIAARAEAIDQAVWDQYYRDLAKWWVSAYLFACSQGQRYEWGGNEQTCFFGKGHWSSRTNDLYTTIWPDLAANRNKPQFDEVELGRLREVYNLLLKNIPLEKNYPADITDSTLDILGIRGIVNSESWAELALETGKLAGFLLVGTAAIAKGLPWVASKIASLARGVTTGARAAETYLASKAVQAEPAAIYGYGYRALTKVTRAVSGTINTVAEVGARIIAVRTRYGTFQLNARSLFGSAKFLSRLTATEQDIFAAKLVRTAERIMDHPLMRRLNNQNPNRMADIVSKTDLITDFPFNGQWNTRTGRISLNEEVITHQLHYDGWSKTFVHELRHADSDGVLQYGITEGQNMFNEGLNDRVTQIIACERFRNCRLGYPDQVEVIRKIEGLIISKERVGTYDAMGIIEDMTRYGGSPDQASKIITGLPDSQSGFTSKIYQYLAKNDYDGAHRYLDQFRYSGGGASSGSGSGGSGKILYPGYRMPQ